MENCLIFALIRGRLCLFLLMPSHVFEFITSIFLFSFFFNCSYLSFRFSLIDVFSQCICLLQYPRCVDFIVVFIFSIIYSLVIGYGEKLTLNYILEFIRYLMRDRKGFSMDANWFTQI